MSTEPRQDGYRAFDISISPGARESLIDFHRDEAATLDQLFSETGQIRTFSRFVTPSGKMFEYYLYSGQLETIRAAMAESPARGPEVAMVEACWDFPQQFVERIYHYEASA